MLDRSMDRCNLQLSSWSRHRTSPFSCVHCCRCRESSLSSQISASSLFSARMKLHKSRRSDKAVDSGEPKMAKVPRRMKTKVTDWLLAIKKKFWPSRPPTPPPLPPPLPPRPRIVISPPSAESLHTPDDLEPFPAFVEEELTFPPLLDDWLPPEWPLRAQQTVQGPGQCQTTSNSPNHTSSSRQ